MEKTLLQMELMNESQLQFLAERTLNLYGIISEVINRNAFTFCTNCSSHGRYCVVADNTMEERESIVALKDSLKHVYNNILYLQILKTSRKKNIHEAVANLEQSITLVIDKVNQFPEKQRSLGILEELTTFLAEFPKTSNGKTEEKSCENGLSRFLISTTRFALEYAVIFASIYATVKFRESTRQRDYNDAIDKVELLVTDASTRLDVLRGRG